MPPSWNHFDRCTLAGETRRALGRGPAARRKARRLDRQRTIADAVGTAAKAALGETGKTSKGDGAASGTKVARRQGKAS
jgi:hypothetical protein